MGPPTVQQYISGRRLVLKYGQHARRRCHGCRDLGPRPVELPRIVQPITCTILAPEQEDRAEVRIVGQGVASPGRRGAGKRGGKVRPISSCELPGVAKHQVRIVPPSEYNGPTEQRIVGEPELRTSRRGCRTPREVHPSSGLEGAGTPGRGPRRLSSGGRRWGVRWRRGRDSTRKEAGQPRLGIRDQPLRIETDQKCGEKRRDGKGARSRALRPGTPRRRGPPHLGCEVEKCLKPLPETPLRRPWDTSEARQQRPSTGALLLPRKGWDAGAANLTESGSIRGGPRPGSIRRRRAPTKAN